MSACVVIDDRRWRACENMREWEGEFREW